MIVGVSKDGEVLRGPDPRQRVRIRGLRAYAWCAYGWRPVRRARIERLLADGLAREVSR